MLTRALTFLLTIALFLLKNRYLQRHGAYQTRAFRAVVFRMRFICPSHRFAVIAFSDSLNVYD
jgi:hypothetical protein